MAPCNAVHLIITATLTIVNIAHNHRIHKCVHDEIYETQELREMKVKYENHPYDKTTINMENEYNSRRLLSPTTTSPIRISAYYDPLTISTTYISSANIDYIKSLMSASIRYYKQFVSVVPVSDTFFVPRHCNYFYDTAWDSVINCYDYKTPFICGQVTIPDDHYGEDYLYFPAQNTSAIKLPTGKGVLNTDLLLYVSYGNDSCATETLAWATTCMQDQYGRPVVGTVNICPKMFADANYWKKDLTTLVHEVAHVLVMNPPLWSSFRDDNGDLIPQSQVFDTTNPMNDTLHYIISPTVKQLARDHYNCPTLPGLPLENTGSPLSVASHWDEKYLQSAMMSANLWSAMNYFTHFTVALMEDSGWYVVNYNYSEPFYWGKNAGCQLWSDKCVNSSTFISNFNQFYCHGVDDYGCSYDYVAPSVCLFYTYASSLPAQFQYFSDSQFGGSQASDFCPFRTPLTTNNDYESVCWDVRGNTFTPDTYPPLQNYAINSRCVDIIDTSNVPNESGYCFEHQCFGYDSINKQWDGVSIKISATENITCTRAQQPGYKTVTTKSASSIGADVTCPDIDAICGTSSQPFACYWGNYNDQQQKCICSPGYTGANCNIQDTSIQPDIESSLTKQPTPSPTMPLSSTLCVENFSQLAWLNDEYTYDGTWNFYSSWHLTAQAQYLFWNIFQHKWLISDVKDTHSYWAFCNVSAWTSDITDCDGHWYVYRSAQDDIFFETNAKAYMGLCGFPVTRAPTKSPTNFPTRSPTINPTKFPTLSPNTRAPTVTNYTYPPTMIPTINPTNNPSTMPTQSPTENPSTIPSKSPSDNPTKYPSTSPSMSPSKNPSTSPTKSPSNNPTGSPSKRIFFRDFSIEFEYMNQTIACNFTLFRKSIHVYTLHYVNNIVFDIDNLTVVNNINDSLIEINYQIASNVSDETLDGIESMINTARFKQLLMDDLEESYGDCVDFKYIGFETSRSKISTTRLVSSENKDPEEDDGSIKLFDWQSYNTTELLIVIGIGVVVFIIICTILYCLIKCCCNGKENTSKLTHSNNAASVVEFGGFQSKPRQKHAVFSNQFLAANNKNIQNIKNIEDDTRWIEI